MMQRSMISAALCVQAMVGCLEAQAQQVSADEARQIARDAYIYAYPMVLMDVSKQVSTNVREPTGLTAPINQLAHGNVGNPLAIGTNVARLGGPISAQLPPPLTPGLHGRSNSISASGKQACAKP